MLNQGTDERLGAQRESLWRFPGVSRESEQERPRAVGRHREFAMACGEMDQAEFRAFLKQTLGCNSSSLARGRIHLRNCRRRRAKDLARTGRTIHFLPRLPS